MPSLKFFVVSESHSIDKDNHRLSLFNIVQDLLPKRFPCRLHRLVTVSSWCVKPEDVGKDFQVKLSILRPGEQRADDFFVNFTGEDDACVIHRLKGMPLDAPGEIKMTVSLNSSEAGTYVINVKPEDPAKGDNELLRYLRLPSPAPKVAPSTKSTTKSPKKSS